MDFSEYFLKLNIVFSLAVILFVLGIFGICFNNDRSILFLMLCIEIILLSSILNFIVFSIWRNDPTGQVYALFVITLAACESALGLGLLVAAYRVNKTIDFEHFETLRG